MTGPVHPFGALLRDWRHRRRMSQLDLATDADISQRHLSFLESGRSAPSREMALHLAERLDIPLRDRNRLLAAAGFAPVYGQRTLDDPGLKAALEAVGQLLEAHEPYPALAVDRHWTLVTGNRAVARLLAGVDEALLAPPVNVLRLSLHPDGLARRIGNFREWKAHVTDRLARQIDNSGDPALIALLEELQSYPVPPGAKPWRAGGQAAHGGIAVPLELRGEESAMSFLSTTTVFGTALDITLSELAIESFFPADAGTAAILRRMAETA
ncbi:helix-turn-helix transcriptional regulator [Kaustia mangrovi]|uniref:Helix-turn-helix transcriptional regulator n=1 Tax=Kaustia mangrovi TaxID=2593653 RepID=A0A7S8C776_9HYPH|nr:helix-turn-helix transcriptional regulator [Kaustia mangrovi]QPC44675.1 helix-turn-helix transcriptional regulator [Kaustia mangrovi]